MFRLEIDTKNAAFFDPDGNTNPNPEVARLLRRAADRIDSGDSDGWLVDTNGNTVGNFDLI